LHAVLVWYEQTFVALPEHQAHSEPFRRLVFTARSERLKAIKANLTPTEEHREALQQIVSRVAEFTRAVPGQRSLMQDRGADGIIAIGPPGAAKSMIAKATGNTAGIPTVAFDLSAMQSSLVGGSGERLRAALQVVDAISQGKSLWIATCNSITSLPPELRRRFTLGTFFFDLPSAEEREAIWKIYLAKWNLDGERPNDEGWTGAEIRECCRKAWRLNLSLKESAEYIVPVSRSAADQIEALRRQASGRFLSAARPGVFSTESDSPAASGRRAFRETE
jgi:SpoVK/Ycf46/Vps4 family AAA+-type ATPase